MINDMVLRSFCAIDNCRKEINNPYNHGDYTYATDGWILIRIPKIDKYNKNPSINMDYFWKSIKLPDIIPDAYWMDIPEIPNGVGKIIKDKIPVLVGYNYLDAKLLQRIKYLPNVKISTVVTYSEYGPVPFKFEGGDGIIMPLRISKKE